MTTPFNCRALKPLHLAVAFALGGMPWIVMAQAGTSIIASYQSYEIPAGPLNVMLLSIARQSGRAISFQSELVAGYKGRVVKGRMTVEEAINTCLQGSDLIMDLTANGTLTVLRGAPPAPADSASTPINVTPLQALIVHGTAVSEDQLYYNPSYSSTVMRTETPLKQIPQSVEVISEKLLKDRQATDLADALKGSAAVQQTRGARGDMTFKIRGFDVQQTSTNGVPNPGLGSSPIQGIARVEVIKGPDSIMSGSSTPGGTINLVRKMPVTKALRVLSLEAAEHGEFKQGIDLGGALNQKESLSYRLNLSNMKSDSTEPDFDGERELYVAPALSWANEATRLTAGVEYSNSRNAAPRSTVAINGKIVDLPTERLFRSDDGSRTESESVYYEFSHSLNQDLSINSKATYQKGTDTARLWQLFGVNPDGSIAFGSPFSGRNNTRSWSLQNDIRTEVKTGAITQKLLVGIDYQHIESTQNERYVPGEDAPYPLVNIYEPDSLDLLPKIGGATYRSVEGRLQQRGLILQNKIDIGERTHVMLATKRAKWISDSKAYRDDGSVFSSGGYNSEKWVPNYGISFDLLPQVTVYANLLHGFTGSSSTNELTGAPLAPQTSKSKEIGAKFSLLDDTLTLTSAYFELQEDNIPISDPITQDIIGSQSRFSKGYDLNFSGEILPGWNVSASYTHVKFDEPSLDSGALSTFSGEPASSANIWTSYELQSGHYKGLGAGIGIDAFSRTKGGSTFESYNVPGGATTDVSVFYHGEDYSLTFGVKNVFDRTLYYSSTASNFIPLQEARSARLTVVYNF